MDFESAIKNDPCFASDRQAELRSSVGLDSPAMKELLERSEFVSLGGFCGISSALESLGLRRSAGPFDWVRSSAEGVLKCFDSNFEDFLTFGSIRVDSGHKVFEDSNWGGSFWHHDIEEQQTKDQFHRRIERLVGIDAVQSPAPRFFIRVANSTAELKFMPKLLAMLQRTYYRSPVYLLVIIDMQKLDSLVQVKGTSSHLLFHRVHEDLWLNSNPDVPVQMQRASKAYAKCISASVRLWADGGAMAPVQHDAVDVHLEGWMDSYNGGDPAKATYTPWGTPPGYTRVPEGRRGGDIVRLHFGKEFDVTLPESAVAGQVLELRLKDDVLRVRLVADVAAAAAVLALMGVTTAATAVTETTAAAAIAAPWASTRMPLRAGVQAKPTATNGATMSNLPLQYQQFAAATAAVAATTSATTSVTTSAPIYAFGQAQEQFITSI